MDGVVARLTLLEAPYGYGPGFIVGQWGPARQVMVELEEEDWDTSLPHQPGCPQKWRQA